MRSKTHQRTKTPLNLSFLDRGFFEGSGKKIIRKDLISDRAHELGSQFAQDQSDKLTASQLRNFFNDVRSLEARVKTEDFETIKPHILMLKSKVSYAFGRKNIPESFKNLIWKCVDKIESKEDFNAFVKFFEAIVGFFYGEGGGRNQ